MFYFFIIQIEEWRDQINWLFFDEELFETLNEEPLQM